MSKFQGVKAKQLLVDALWENRKLRKKIVGLEDKIEDLEDDLAELKLKVGPTEDQQVNDLGKMILQASQALPTMDDDRANGSTS